MIVIAFFSQNRNTVVNLQDLNSTFIPSKTVQTYNCGGYSGNSPPQEINRIPCRFLDYPNNPVVNVYGVCQYIEGDSTVGSACKFPFK